MTDRELLERAAKAAGVSLRLDILRDESREWEGWNPLTDDGDAFRLAVKLRLDICRPAAASDFVCVWDDAAGDFIQEPHGTDPYAATRRAIVRAAAQMGE